MKIEDITTTLVGYTSEPIGDIETEKVLKGLLSAIRDTDEELRKKSED